MTVQIATIGKSQSPGDGDFTVRLRHPIQRAPVRIWNSMARTHRRGNQPPAELTKESLTAAAVKRTGLSNFGKESFVEPLQRLIESLNASAKLHAFGRFYARQMLVELLCNRLYKGPCHLATIGPLMELYPDMYIIQTHRDPVKAIPSECSLMAALRGITSDELNNAEIGEQATALLSHDLERGAAARAKHDPSHFYDVYYNDLINNPMTVLQRIYDHFKLPLTSETAAKMRAELKESPQNKRGLHRYSFKQFSLDGDALRDQFHWYYQRFNLPVEQ